MNNLSFTFYDVVSTLIPGLAFVSLVYYFSFRSIDGVPPEALLGILIVAGYLVGLAFLTIGTWLFGTYFHPNQYVEGSLKHRVVKALHKTCKMLVRQNYHRTGLDVHDELKSKLEKIFNLEDLDDLGIYQICDLIAADSALDRDSLLAKEATLRSLVVTLLFSYVYLLIVGKAPGPIWAQLVVVVILLKLLLYGSNYYKKIRQSQVYLAAYLKLKKGEKYDKF